MLRDRWILISGAIVIAVLGALAYSLLVTPRYEASTVLFVSATGDGNATADQRRRHLRPAPGAHLHPADGTGRNLVRAPSTSSTSIWFEGPAERNHRSRAHGHGLDQRHGDRPSPSRARDIAEHPVQRVRHHGGWTGSSDGRSDQFGDHRPAARGGAGASSHPENFTQRRSLPPCGCGTRTLIALVRDRLINRSRPRRLLKAAGVGILVGDIRLMRKAPKGNR